MENEKSNHSFYRPVADPGISSSGDDVRRDIMIWFLIGVLAGALVMALAAAASRADRKEEDTVDS